VKVKAHRGDPLNVETDIRTEMGCQKEQKEDIWDCPTNRTVYQWAIGLITRSTTWSPLEYASIKSALEQTLGPQGLSVSQRSFIEGARSLNELRDLHDNLAYFKVRDLMGVQKIMTPMTRWTLRPIPPLITSFRA
jgi:hypothetical protein